MTKCRCIFEISSSLVQRDGNETLRLWRHKTLNFWYNFRVLHTSVVVYNQAAMATGCTHAGVHMFRGALLMKWRKRQVQVHGLSVRFGMLSDRYTRVSWVKFDETWYRKYRVNAQSLVFREQIKKKKKTFCILVKGNWRESELTHVRNPSPREPWMYPILRSKNVVYLIVHDIWTLLRDLWFIINTCFVCLQLCARRTLLLGVGQHDNCNGSKKCFPLDGACYQKCRFDRRKQFLTFETKTDTQYNQYELHADRHKQSNSRKTSDDVMVTVAIAIKTSAIWLSLMSELSSQWDTSLKLQILKCEFLSKHMIWPWPQNQ